MHGEFAMTIKTILSAIGINHSEQDLVAAAELARELDADLDAIVISSVPPPPVEDLIGQTYSTWSFAWEDENNRTTARAAELRDLLGAKGFEADVQPVYCLNENVDEEVARRAAYSDVTVLGSNMLKDAYLLKRVLDGALFASPAPVVLSSESQKVTLAPKTVLVAWNSALEAGVAVRQAMGMLAAAEHVHVVLVDPVARAYAMGDEPGADIARFLSRHGVEVTVEVLASAGRDPAFVLQRHATDIGADIIVMGAYGHWRLRERLFGGTTQTMLGNITTPVFMAR